MELPIPMTLLCLPNIYQTTGTAIAGLGHAAKTYQQARGIKSVLITAEIWQAP